MRSAHSFGDVRGARQQSRCGRQSLALIELSPFLQERAGWPQDIGAVVVLEGMDAASGWDPEARELLLKRLQRWTEAFPRATQVVHGPLFGSRMPYWLAMPNLDLEKQIGVVTVSAPSDERVLLDTCAKLWLEPFDITSPLWRLWLLDGLAEGSYGDPHSIASRARRWSCGSRFPDPALRA